MSNVMNNWGRVLISIIVVAGFLAVLILVLTRKLEGNSTPEVLLVMLGALAAGFQQVISYWVGSSAGSAMKDQALATVANKP
jgi:protein-S-isoprenylcysteine O-methyltransferase Ste14